MFNRQYLLLIFDVTSLFLPMYDQFLIVSSPFVWQWCCRINKFIFFFINFSFTLCAIVDATSLLMLYIIGFGVPVCNDVAIDDVQQKKKYCRFRHVIVLIVDEFKMLVSDELHLLPREFLAWGGKPTRERQNSVSGLPHCLAVHPGSSSTVHHSLELKIHHNLAMLPEQISIAWILPGASCISSRQICLKWVYIYHSLPLTGASTHILHHVLKLKIVLSANKTIIIITKIIWYKIILLKIYISRTL